jgi:hypothetical protein
MQALLRRMGDTCIQRSDACDRRLQGGADRHLGAVFRPHQHAAF